MTSNIALAAADIARVADQLRTMIGDDDEQLYADMLEGETDLHGIASRLLADIETDQGNVAALSDQMAARKERKDRAERRNETRRAALLTLLEAAKLRKLALPEATLSVRDVPAKLSVNKDAPVPQEYCVPTWKPDMDAIKEAFGKAGPLPNWLRLDPPRQSLTVRTK